ncbi:MAG: hypothetical protein Q9173_001538 [Seirophora scorigena]
MEGEHMHRLETHDLELGATEAVQKHYSRHVEYSSTSIFYSYLSLLELAHQLTSSASFPGIAAIASFTLNLASEVGVTAYGSLFQVGWAFTIGIAFAIITCAPTSGGHFNPAITICFAIWQGFPWKKVPHYIFSQVFGAFIAGLLMVDMYWPEIQRFKAESIAAGKGLMDNGGPASLLCTFPNPNQS